MSTQQTISAPRAWVMATRPKTLAAAAVPVAVGTGVAVSHDQFQWLPALVALLGAFLIQIGTNLANDYFDFQKGADNEDRLGPTRVVSSGLISAKAVRNAMILAFALAAAVGSYLIWLGGWPILVIGVLSIMSGIAYTGGPFPLGYNGLGDLFVFIFFGVVAVMGTYYVQALEWSLESFVASVPVGLLSVAILIVNNYRDIDTDRAAGKMTLAVRLGRSLTRVQYQ
ncbi:MAG: 1,4-dihydroxy-2-naphthoate polyprenyltransferase, partial [Myxococcota bacterium]